MISAPILVALVALGLDLVASGVLLLRRPGVPASPRLAGGLLIVAGVAMTGGAALDAAARPTAAGALFTVAGALAVPLAVTTYPRSPRPLWRRPVDGLALVLLIGAGGLAATSTGLPDLVGPSTAEAMFFVITLTLIAHTWWRIEQSSGAERRALTWTSLAGGAAALLAGLIAFAAPTVAGGVVAFVGLGALGPAMVLGVAPRQVIDVRALVVRTVVGTLTAVTYVAVFTVVVAGLDLLGVRDLPLGTLGLVCAVLALGVHPVGVILRGVIDEVLFGHRPDPLGAAAEVAGTLGGQLGADPETAVRAVRQALTVPYVAVFLDGALLAASGTPVTDTRRRPLALDGDRRGELVVGLRPGDLSFSSGELHVLTLVATLISQMVRLIEASAALQASREGTVAALAEERRRLRRDLHDGLGPRLTGIAFTADAARNSLSTDPGGAAELLAGLRAETTSAIEEIRRLVYAMRPPALDELGLIGALRQQVRGMRTASGAALVVEVHAAELPEPLPAATEVAAYRIVVEALTNTARHSGCEQAEVRLGLAGGHLVVEVVDHGRSPDGRSAWRPGVGLTSMSERAAEVGGTLTAGPDRRPGRLGGRVRASLPLVSTPPVESG